jgi:hypothetical protein
LPVGPAFTGVPIIDENDKLKSVVQKISTLSVPTDLTSVSTHGPYVAAQCLGHLRVVIPGSEMSCNLIGTLVQLRRLWTIKNISVPVALSQGRL